MIYSSRSVACVACRPRAIGQMDLEALKEFSAQNPEGSEFQFVGGTATEELGEHVAEQALHFPTTVAKPERVFGEWGGLLLAALIGVFAAGALKV